MLGEILFDHLSSILGKPDCCEINQYNCFAVYDTTLIRLVREVLVITSIVIDDTGDRRWEFHLADPDSLPAINKLLSSLAPCIPINDVGAAVEREMDLPLISPRIISHVLEQ